MSIVERIDKLMQSGLSEEESIHTVAKEDGKDPVIVRAMNITFRKYAEAFKNLRDR